MTKYFTNNFSIINLHKRPSVKSEVVTQMLFGESFSISKKSKKWLKVKIKEDGYKGFVKNNLSLIIGGLNGKECLLYPYEYFVTNNLSPTNKLGSIDDEGI